MGYSCISCARCCGSSDSYYMPGYTSDVMISESMTIEQRLGPITQNYSGEVLYIKIHDTNGLELDPNVIHPFVRMHIIDLNTHHYIEKAHPNTTALSYHEEMSQFDASKNFTSGTCEFIPPFSTPPCDMRITGECDPHWNQEFYIDEEATRLLHSNVVFLFEILDFNFRLIKERSKLLRDDHLYPVAWAFFRPVGSAKLHLGTTKLQLYRYKFEKPVGFNELRRPAVYYDFNWYKKDKYPSFLRVEIKAVNRPRAEIIKWGKALSPFQKEEGKKTFEELEAEADQPRKLLLAGQEELDEEGLARAKRLTSWKRLYQEPCRIPNKLVFKLHSSKLGCWRLAFSNNGKYLACGCTDTTTVIRIYQIEDGELSLTLQGHTDLIHDIIWSENDYFLLTASSDGSAKVWDLTRLQTVGAEGMTLVSLNPGTAEELLVSINHPSYVYCARFHPDQRYDGAMFIATACFDGKVRLWLVTQGYESVDPNTQGMTIGGAYQLLAEIDVIPKSMFEYEQIQRNQVAEEEQMKRYPNFLAFDNQGQLYIGDSLGVIYFWSVQVRDSGIAPNLIREMEIDELTGDVINAIHLQPPDKRLLLVQTRDNIIRRIQPALGSHETTADLVDSRYVGAKIYKYSVRSCISPDGQFLASGSEDGKGYVWDIARAFLEDTSEWEASVKDLMADIAWNNTYHMVALAPFGSELPILVYIYEKKPEEIEEGLLGLVHGQKEAEMLAPQREVRSQLVNQVYDTREFPR